MSLLEILQRLVLFYNRGLGGYLNDDPVSCIIWVEELGSQKFILNVEVKMILSSYCPDIVDDILGLCSDTCDTHGELVRVA